MEPEKIGKKNGKGSRKMETYRVLIEQADAALLRDLNKLMNRIEKLLTNSQSLIFDPILDRIAQLNRRLQKGLVFTDVGLFETDAVLDAYSKNSEMIVRRIDWPLFESELLQTLGTESIPPIVAAEIAEERSVHDERLQKAAQKEKARQLLVFIA